MANENKMVWYPYLPDREIEVYEPYLRLFFETMYERHMIWYKRFVEQRKAPWTKDKIFQENKFTNVYRELDRNSQWEIKNIILDDSLDLRNLVWKVMVFRIFNNIETFEFDPKGFSLQGSLFGPNYKSGLEQIENPSELISAKKWRNGIPDYEEYDEEEFSRFIAGIRSVGKNPFTNAYVLNSRATPGQQRDYCYTRAVLPAFHDNIDTLIDLVRNAKKPEEIIEFLKSLPSVADFIAHEFYQDFTYISRYTNRDFMRFDQNDFTSVGPGAQIGIRLIYPNIAKPKSEEQELKWLLTASPVCRKRQTKGIYMLRDVAEEWLTIIGKEKGKPMPYLYWDKENREYCIGKECNITLHQIEMWLCEFCKYWKMKIGMGRQRQKFIPKTKQLIVN